MNTKNSRKTPYPEELEFVENIRKENLEVGPYTLAHRIMKDEFGTTAAFRSFYSTLSVIRRYDARMIKTTVAA